MMVFGREAGAGDEILIASYPEIPPYISAALPVIIT